MRYMINDTRVRHAPFSRVCELLEMMVCGDVVTVRKEIGSGWRVEVHESDVPQARVEDER